MNDEDKKIIKRSVSEAVIATLMTALGIFLAVCVAALVFNL